jgi:hypothetical protein
MRAAPSSVPPLPESRALLVVVDAARSASGGSRDALANAALNHPQAPGFEAAGLRRLAESYGDAQQGFRRPQASVGYVVAALYTIRRRIAVWIGIPFLVLMTVGTATWGISEYTRREELALLRSRCRSKIETAQKEARSAGNDADTIERAVRSAQPPLLNESRIRDLLQAFRGYQDTARAFFSAHEPYNGLDPRRLRALRLDADGIGDTVSAMKNLLEQLQDQFGKSQELRSSRDQLDGLFKEAQALNTVRTQTTPTEIHALGVRASELGDTDALANARRELSEFVARARELAELPNTLNARIAQIRAVALDEEDRKRAERLYRDGRDAAAASHIPALKESVAQLRDMAATLEQEYTIVITGGKWRYRRNNPSVKSYYVIVEAIDPAGRRLPRIIRNEEDGSSSSVTQWGERVPFEVYERVRRDKQDNGVIEQNEFGRKERGRMEERVTLRLENGEPLPRAGKITRW